MRAPFLDVGDSNAHARHAAAFRYAAVALHDQLHNPANHQMHVASEAALCRIVFVNAPRITAVNACATWEGTASMALERRISTSDCLAVAMASSTIARKSVPSSLRPCTDLRIIVIASSRV